ncbi:hypothetical protein TELCIR_08068 [Teladorsagia circumcincta]|uniref:Uncharacterized protein n=1 Tax=Teladorsagia circumcincta TaxID=45464 RepID=A0A2G9UKS6_TELCI|nr:hypothetical protein TELCIR_08068 [Teladorsagia circumcincta]
MAIVWWSITAAMFANVYLAIVVMEFDSVSWLISVTRRTHLHATRTPNVYTEKRSAHTSANVCEGSLETEFDVFLMLNLRRVVRSRVFVTLMLSAYSITKQTRLHACANQDLLVMEPIDVILRRCHVVRTVRFTPIAVNRTPLVDGNANAMLDIKEMDIFAVQ